MAVDYSGLIPQLDADVDRSARGSLGQQIETAIRGAIRSGAVRSGERLPSTRQLAEQLGVSRGLVVTAYEQLLAEGYVISAVGSGTTVAGPFEGEDSAASPAASLDSAERVPVPRIDFGYGVPDLRSFPTRDWLWALGDAVKAMPSAQLGDGPVEGDPHLRAVLAAYHRRVRAGCAEAARTVVVGGFRQALNFVLAALVAHGIDRVGLEDPGPRDHDQIARRAGLRVAAVAVDEDGVRVDLLRASGVRAVLLTPAHQCPTGAVLSPTRRRDLVQWAHDVDGVIIEDDYDAEFRYDRQPAGSVQGLAPDRVIAIGSVSKTLAPALRIGWIFTPARYLTDILTEKELSSRGVPQLDQAALARLIESGRFDRHLRKVRDRYRRRRDALVSAVSAAMPGATVTGLDAGQHVLLVLPPGSDEQRLVARARNAGIAVAGLTDYRVDSDDASHEMHVPAALVIGFGNVTVDQIHDGITTLGKLIAHTPLRDVRPADDVVAVARSIARGRSRR